MPEPVFDGNGPDLLRFPHRFLDGGSDPSCFQVFLCNEHDCILCDDLIQQIRVQRLDHRQIVDSGFNTHATQPVSSSQAFPDHDTTGNQRHSFSASQLGNGSGIKNRFLFIHRIHRRSGQPEIGRSLICCKPLHHGGGFQTIRRLQHHHTREHPHQPDIFQTLVAAAVFAHGDPRMGGAQLYIEMRIGDGVPDLFIGPAGQKHGKAGGKGFQSGYSHPRCDPCHIAFGDPHLYKLSGGRFLCFAGFGGRGQIRIQHDDVRILDCQFCQCLSKSFSCCLSHFPVSSSCINASCSCMALGALPCQPAWFSINDTPLPFTV